ncbi:MAG: ABC transporter ATP-binding protein [Peptococcaceae bacterium]|jgi:NitT/TauT family transport system ATP-binding protein|nr:ABC transporter ATP-binding protein [Peptococcaceae bacterium]
MTAANSVQTAKPPEQAYKIEIDSLNQSFSVRGEGRKQKQELIVLEGFNLSVSEGEFITVVGPSGCGKSTLLDIIAGLSRPKAGSIYIDGKKISGPALDRGFVMQQYALLPWRTVSRNIELGLEVKGVPRKIRAEISRKYIDLVGLRGFEKSFPHELSGGMRQRVAIARSLAYDPEVLLMDEPFAAVDAQTRGVLQDELMRIWEETQKTIIFVTHSIEEAALLADRVVVMGTHPGRVKAIVKVDLPRPRNSAQMNTSSDFIWIRNRLWELLQSDAPPGRALPEAAETGQDVADEIAPDAVL